MASTDSHQFNPCFLITVSPGEQESGCYGAVSVEFKKITWKQGDREQQEAQEFSK